MRLPSVECSIIVYLAITCLAFKDLTFSLEPDTIWKNILSFTKSDQTIFLDTNNDNSLIFKDGVLKSIHHYNHSVIVLRNDSPSHDEKLRLLRENPNIIFTTKFLNSNMFDCPLVQKINTLKLHWSAVIIISTIEDSSYNCDNGNFNKKVLNHIEQFLNDLWHKHRIMNVCLNLPYVCPNEYVIFNTTKPNNGKFFNRTIKLVRKEELSALISRQSNSMLTLNYPLRANIFYRFPTAIQECAGTDIYIKTRQEYSGGFCGMDGLVMSDIVRHFQFNLSLPTLTDSNKYGYQRYDGTITGSLGSVVKREVDVSFNSRFMEMYTTAPLQYVYIYHVACDALCAVLNQPDEEPLWLYPVNAYSILQWILILACLISIGILMWLFAKINKIIYNNRPATPLSYILSSVNAGLFGFFFKRRRDLLLLRVCCLYASIMVLAEYQGYINYIFTTRVRYDVLNTLSDLAKSKIVIQTSPSIYPLIRNSNNKIEDILLSRTIVLENINSFEYVVTHPNSATLDRTDAIMLTLMKYTDEDGKPKLYVLDECLRFFYLSYIASIDFPFRGILRMFMMRLEETGLAQMYATWTSRALGLEMTLPNLYSEPRPAAKIRMEEQIIAFGVLLVGYAMSAVAFGFEIWMARRQKYPFMH